MTANRSINLLTFKDDNMARRFLEMNGIKGAFVWRNGPREWEVLEGKPDESTGFNAGVFTTRREAQRLANAINARIAQLS